MTATTETVTIELTPTELELLRDIVQTSIDDMESFIESPFSEPWMAKELQEYVVNTKALNLILTKP
jgi:hypothetical protein